MQITVKAFAKINWVLDILSRREDGYHELDMLMQTIDLCDEITFTSSKWTTLTVNGRTIANSGKNLVIRAVQSLNEYTGEKRTVKIDLKKRIPVRAGLGGGSADCAATLLALNEHWRLKLPMKTLLKIGERLGADVPYCMTGGLCRVRGIGDIIERLNSSNQAVLLIHAVGEGLSTQTVFSEFDTAEVGKLGLDVERVASFISASDYHMAYACSGNALERAAIRLLPEIDKEIQQLKRLGAIYARMSGSGSAVYGVFETEEAAKRAQGMIPGSFIARTMSNIQI